MVALTSERNTRLRIGDLRVEPVAAAVKIWGGSLIMRNAAGYLTKGATATNCVAVGRAEKTVDNSAGANGAVNIEYRAGIVDGIEATGVWVRMDEALARAA